MRQHVERRIDQRVLVDPGEREGPRRWAVDDLIGTAKDVMEAAADPAVHLDVKLVVDAGQGDNWAEAH